MKSSEVHRIIKRNGWTLDRIKGSHYIYSVKCPSMPFNNTVYF